MKEKLSISVEKELIKKADSLIDGVGVRNRSQAFEHVLKSYFSGNDITDAIVLLGRYEKISKESIAEIVEKLRETGIKKAIIAGAKNNSKIFSMIENGEKYGVKIEYLNEEQLLGTAGCVKSAQKMLESAFLVIAGDTYFDFEIEKMEKYHFQKKSIATMGVTAVKLEDSTDSIGLEGEKIISFNYGAGQKTHITNAGIYIFSPEIFSQLPSKGSLERDIFPKLAKEGKLYAYAFYKEWKHNE